MREWLTAHLEGEGLALRELYKEHWSGVVSGERGGLGVESS